MNDLQNNKELVAAGHEFARLMSSDTAIIEIAKMVTRLAERLDCTTAALRAMQSERDQLAAECAERKSAAKKVIKMNRQHAKDKHGNSDIAESWACVKVLRQVNTPATDAFLAEQRAQGIEQWIASRNGAWNGTTKEAEKFAAQLRNEVKG